ncbi:MAG: hypothetical protein KAG61_09105 [Bacteriovoracaceae bacterium]|nr:hypothetical protein [Bacteriovoracaceae bacterium]
MRFIILIALLLLTVTSCNQNSLGALTAAKNLISAPVRQISSAISNYEYKKIEDKTEALRKEGKLEEHRPSISCTVEDPTKPIKLSFLDKLMQKTRNGVCSCIPWGDCNKDLCDCSILCPNNFDIFRKPPIDESISDLTRPENSLLFRNMSSLRIASIKGTQGYCWGHASITSKFNRVGFFKPDSTEKREDLNASPKSEKYKNAIKFYKGIIDDISNNKVREIPGFKYLQELSAHPDLQSYIADKVAKTWADKAMTFSGMKVALGSTKMHLVDSQKLMDEVIKKIDNHQQPQIVFTYQGKKFQTHAVLVSHYVVEGGKTYLCIRDNESSPSFNHKCSLRMFIDRTGSIAYAQAGTVGTVAVAHNENSDSIAQFKALKEHCDEKKSCKNK